jgi:hypothetical protein
VVGVEVGEDDVAHVGGAEAERLDLRADLLVGGDLLANGEAVVHVPAREPAGLERPCGLAGVDDDEAVGVLDQPGEDRQRLGEAPVGEGQGEPHRAGPLARALALVDRDGSGLDGVDAHGCSPRWRCPARARRRGRRRGAA